jgi:hypothetical protein
MARIPNVSVINEEKLRLLNIARNSDESMLLTIDEVKESLRGFIKEELGYFAEDVTKQRRLDLEERLNFKLKQFENSMIRHIDDKINKITERIVELSLNRTIEQEVEKRLNKKLEKIKKAL